MKSISLSHYYRKFKVLLLSFLKVNDIIHQMVKNCSIDVIIDHLIGECIENHRWKLQTVFVLNEVIRSSQQLEGTP